MLTLRRAGLAAAMTAAPIGIAYRFALAYRARAGFPRPRPPRVTPAYFGLPWEEIEIQSGDLRLPGWFIPARDGAPGPGVLLVHGWESARDRTLPNAQFLHAAGFHCLTLDVRGHGANPAEALPMGAGEFGADALAGFEALMSRAEVTTGAILGHSMGAVGSALAAASDPRVAALVATATPADPYRLTRQTFRLARLPFPDPLAYPLAWLTTRVFLAPRGHRVAATSASAALTRFEGPVLLVHGERDHIVPVAHLQRLATAARASRRDPDRRVGDGPDPGGTGKAVETLLLEEGQHSWLYEFPRYRRTVTAFLARHLGGPFEPGEAGELAAAVPAARVPDAQVDFSAVADEPGGVRSLIQLAWAATRRPVPDEPELPDALDPSDAVIDPPDPPARPKGA
jgi:uncharacterized protein